jgi:hypothetical protein
MTIDEHSDPVQQSFDVLFRTLVETREEWNRCFDSIENKLDLFTAALVRCDANLKNCVNIAEETVKRMHEERRLYQERAALSVPVQQL